MNNSNIAAIKAGRSFLEVLATVSLATHVKTFHSISKTSRNDFIIGTTQGVSFVKWVKLEKKFEVIRQIPTSNAGPALTFMGNRQTLQCCEVTDDHILTSDYNQPGYYLINRATKDIKKLEEVISDNRGCFDIKPLPNFHLTDFPFVLVKARKGVVLLNLATLKSFELLRTPEMQGNSSFAKLSVSRKRTLPRKSRKTKFDLVVTHVEMHEGRTIVE